MPVVTITTAGHTIVVDSDRDDMAAVADRASTLWRATRDPKLDAAWSSSGFQTERMPQQDANVVRADLIKDAQRRGFGDAALA